MRLEYAVPVALGATAAGAATDWRVVIGAAIGAFLAHVVGATMTKREIADTVKTAISEHVSSCPNRLK